MIGKHRLQFVALIFLLAGTFAPVGFCAIVRGAGGSTGIAVVEVYALN